jgi:hypothetical protein
MSVDVEIGSLRIDGALAAEAGAEAVERAVRQALIAQISARGPHQIASSLQSGVLRITIPSGGRSTVAGADGSRP